MMVHPLPQTDRTPLGGGAAFGIFQRLALSPRTAAWDTPPGSGWWSHRHPTGHTTVVLLPAGMKLAAGEAQRLLQIWDHTQSRSQSPIFRVLQATGGKRRVAKMMEEIDRFQVPSAAQEAEMQAEMQPLVSVAGGLLGMISQYLGFVFSFYRIKLGADLWMRPKHS